MSFKTKNLTSQITSAYNLMISKLISLLQSHLIELISPNKSNFSSPNSFESAIKQQKYVVLLGKMKILQEEQQIYNKYSQLCQPLLKTFQQIDEKSSSFNEKNPRNTHSLSFKNSKVSSLYQSLEKSSQQISPIKNSLDLKRMYQIKRGPSPNYQKMYRTIEPKTDQRGRKHVENLRNFEKYKTKTEASQQSPSTPNILDSLRNCYEPQPGKNYMFQDLMYEESFQKEPSIPYHKNEIVLKKNLKGKQISNRTMTDFSRDQNLQKIVEEGQLQGIDGLNQKQVFSFDMAETPTGTVYGKQEQVNGRSRFKLAMYKRFIDRAHLKNHLKQ